MSVGDRNRRSRPVFISTVHAHRRTVWEFIYSKGWMGRSLIDVLSRRVAVAKLLINRGGGRPEAANGDWKTRKKFTNCTGQMRTEPAWTADILKRKLFHSPLRRNCGKFYSPTTLNWQTGIEYATGRAEQSVIIYLYRSTNNYFYINSLCGSMEL